MFVRLIKSLAIICLPLLIGSCATKPVAEDFGFSSKLLTIASERGGMFYLLRLELEPQVPANSQVFLRYERLDKPGEFTSLALGSIGEARIVNFRSISSPAVKREHIYQLQVHLQNAETMVLVGSFNALVKPNIELKVSNLLGIKLL